MSDLNVIRRRKTEIAEELTRLQSAIGKAQAEYRDLQIAERVLVNLLGDRDAEASESSEQPTARSGGGKPDGTPSVTEMINKVLEEATKEGLRGLEPKEMTTRIGSRWWPDVRPDDVNGIAWRMWKRGQLLKNGAVYMLPKTDEAADDGLGEGTSAASDHSDLLG